MAPSVVSDLARWLVGQSIGTQSFDVGVTAPMRAWAQRRYVLSLAFRDSWSYARPRPGTQSKTTPNYFRQANLTLARLQACGSQQQSELGVAPQST